MTKPAKPHANMTKTEVVAVLKQDNPREQEMRLAMFADLYVEYRKAVANIAEHGSIVSHPRTNEPITNPFLAVRDKAMATLLKLRMKTPAEMWA
jgi:phage terminase small subunit